MYTVRRRSNERGFMGEVVDFSRNILEHCRAHINSGAREHLLNHGYTREDVQAYAISAARAFFDRVCEMSEDGVHVPMEFAGKIRQVSAGINCIMAAAVLEVALLQAEMFELRGDLSDDRSKNQRS